MTETQRRLDPRLVLHLAGLLVAAGATVWLTLDEPALPLWPAGVTGLGLITATGFVLANKRWWAAGATLVALAGLAFLPTGIETIATRATGLVLAAGLLVFVETGERLTHEATEEQHRSQAVQQATTWALAGRLALMAAIVAGLALVPVLLGPLALPSLAGTSVEVRTAWGVLAIAVALLSVVLLVGAARHREGTEKQ